MANSLRLLRSFGFAALLLCAPAALSQERIPGTDARSADRPALKYAEIERGFFFGVQAGPFFLLKAPGPEGSIRPFSSGQMVQVELGFDIGQYVTLGLFGMGAHNRAGTDYIGFSSGEATGDFTSLAGGGVLRGKFVGFEDAQGVKRTWLYLRAGAGYALFRPEQLLPDSDILVFAGPGVEYYTPLRHFSVGLEVSGTMLVRSKSMGFTVSPNLRYAF